MYWTCTEKNIDLQVACTYHSLPSLVVQHISLNSFFVLHIPYNKEEKLMYSFGQKCSNFFRPRAGIEVIWRATKACSICGVFDKVRKTRMEKKKKKIAAQNVTEKNMNCMGVCTCRMGTHKLLTHRVCFGILDVTMCW